MQTIFDSSPLPAAKRHQAWRDAICDIYLPVDCAADERSDYAGFVRELRLGPVVLTDALSSPQRVLRQSHHVARHEKDCYYLGLTQTGGVEVRQADSAMTLHTGRGGLFYANEPYELRSRRKLRSFWLELPRRDFASRFDSQNHSPIANFDLSRGLGRVVVELCVAVAAEGTRLDPESRAQLGEQIMDIVALALNAAPEREPAAELCVKSARLRSVKNYIEEHIDDPNLSLRKIAQSNGISLRYLHQLFRTIDMSVSEWLRMRRLQRCYDLLTSPQHAAQSITDIAYGAGFSSSSHFSNLFRATFGLRPSDVRGAGRVQKPVPRTAATLAEHAAFGGERSK